uniref:Uncharacterized protein n=1 Tax=Romanomermis culicivorax TaxID=13658 RepID=A0A915KLI4_ROMCU
MLFPEHHWMDYSDPLRDEIQRILLPRPSPPPPTSQPVQIAQTAPVVAQTALPPPTAQLPPMVPIAVQPPKVPTKSVLALNHHSQPIKKNEHSVKWKTQQQDEVEYRKAHKTRMRDELHARQTLLPSTLHTERGKTPSERTTRRREQRAQQKARETAGQTSSTTGVTVQPKVMRTKSAASAHTPPACHSDSHRSRDESHRCDDHHRKETKHSLHRDTTTSNSHQHTTSNSHQHNPRVEAPPHHTQSEQTRQVHSTGFYEGEYQHSFRRSPPKLTDYISPLHRDAEIQKGMDNLKNPPKPEFKTPLPPAPLMDVEQTASSSASLLQTTASLLPMASTLVQSTATISVQSVSTSTVTIQPQLVITTCPALGAATAAIAVLQFQPR